VVVFGVLWATLTAFLAGALLLDAIFSAGYVHRQLKQRIKQSRSSAAAFLLIKKRNGW
jgi:hypothetical protein